MDYFSLGSKLDYPDLNAIVYLLRKFKRLTSTLKLGSNSISSDYGTYTVTGGLTSVGGNFILEDDVTISSSDVLLNCFYTFYFTVVDVNLSGTVNRRVVSVTGDTGNNGELSVVLSPDLLESDEVILPDFKVDIVFDEHEYYTPVSSLDITLTVDKEYITVGESNTVTATVLDSTGSPVEDLELQFSFNGDIVTDITDEDGVASADYTGVGVGWVTVTVSGRSIQFFDGCMVATVTGNSITLGESAYRLWLGTVGNVIVDWGDGTTNTVNNPIQKLSHTYTDGLSEHNITFYGEVTSLGYDCFYRCTGLTSIFIPNSVTSLGTDCFNMCTGLTSVTIPEGVTSLGWGCFANCTGLISIIIPNNVTNFGKVCFLNCSGLTSVVIPYNVTSIGDDCFTGCTSLIDYELYWAGDSILDSSKMLINANTVFTIPHGQTSNYTAKNYPSSKLVERDTPIHTYSLSIASDKSSILTSESVTITGTLLMDSSPYTGQSIQLYDGSTLIDTLTTDSNGEYNKTITGLTAGTHTFKAVNTNAESSTVTVTVTEPTPVHNYSITITGDSIIQTGDTDNIIATLKDNGVVVSGETLNYQIKHGSTVIDSGTDTTDSNGQISISYVGTGVGDVDVIVSYGSLLQETYELVDYWAYDTLTVDKQKYSITSGSATMTYSSNGLYIKGTVSTDTPISSTITVPVEYTAELDCDFNGNANYSTSIIFDDLNTVHTGSKLEVYYESTNTKIKTINVNVSKTGTLKIRRTGTSMEIYWDDTLLDTITGISSTGATGFRTYNNRQATFKNLRIKAL